MDRDPEELPPLPLDEDRVFSALHRHDVDYVLIGGGALMVLGIGERETFDLDLVPSRETPNLERLGAALRELESRVITRWDPSSQDLIVAASDFEPEVFEKNRTLHLLTSAGRVDVLEGTPAAERGFSDLSGHARALERSGVVVTVAAVPDLIRMKEAAGRAKDREDLRSLYPLAGPDLPPPETDLGAQLRRSQRRQRESEDRQPPPPSRGRARER